MLIQSQKKFIEDYLKPLGRGETVKLPAGYAAMYEKWLDFNSEIIGRLSAEEKAKSIIDFLDEKIPKAINSLIKGDSESDQKKRHLNARGQLVLASADAGKTFDKLITPDDLGNTLGQNYFFLSTTLKSTTTNIKELMDEQVMLHVAEQLKNLNYLVENAVLEGGLIELTVRNQKGLKSDVKVDPAQSTEKPLDYVFTNEKGVVEVVPETQLFDKQGQMKPDPTLKPSDNSRMGLALALAGGMLATLPLALNQGTQDADALNFAAPTPSAAPTMPRMEKPQIAVPAFENVQASKRKFEERKKGEETTGQVEKEKQAKYEEDARKKLLERAQAQPETPKKPVSQSPIKRAALASLGMGGILLGGLGGTVATTMYLTTIIKP